MTLGLCVFGIVWQTHLPAKYLNKFSHRVSVLLYLENSLDVEKVLKSKN